MKKPSKIDLLTSASLYLAVFLIPFYFLRFTFLSIPTNWLEIGIIIFVVLAVICQIFEKKKLIYLPLWAYIFVTASFIGLFLADDRVRALGIVKGWFLLPLLFAWATINYLKYHRVPSLAWPSFLSGLVVALWAVLQKFGFITTLFYQKTDPSFGQYLSGDFRVFGPFESPNYLAMFLVPTIFLSLPLFGLAKNRLAQLLILSGYLLMVLAVYFSGSRAGIIALFLSPIIYILVSGRVGTVGSLVLKVSLMLTSFIALSMAIFQFGLNPGSDSIRLEIYKYSLILVKKYWFLGIGLGDFQNRITTLTENAESFRTFALPYALHPHNVFMAVWLNLGLLGLVAFIFLLIDYFKRVRKSYNFNLYYAGSFLAIVSILIHGLFDTTYFKNDISMLFWLAFAIGYLLYRKPKVSFTINK